MLNSEEPVYTPQSPYTEPQALARIRATRRQTRIALTAGEPKWHHALSIASLVQTLGLQNDNTIVSAVTAHQVQLGAFTIDNPLEEIRICRNFVAHKGAATLTDVRNLPTAVNFTDLRAHCRALRFGVETFSEWKEGCLAVAYAAAQ